MNILQTFTSRLSNLEVEQILRAHIAKEHPNFKVKTVAFETYPSTLGIGGGVVAAGYVGAYQPPYFTGASIILEPLPRPPRSAQAYEA